MNRTTNVNIHNGGFCTSNLFFALDRCIQEFCNSPGSHDRASQTVEPSLAIQKWERALFLRAVNQVSTENGIVDCCYWGNFFLLSDQILTKKISLEGHFPAIWRL